MDGRTGITNRKRYMKAQNNIILLACCFVLCGCASIEEYQLYVDTQKTLNKDHTMAELARISALTEIVKNSDDPKVKIEAIKALRELQKSTIERPKTWFER